MEGGSHSCRMLAGDIEKLNGSSNVQGASSTAFMSLPPQGPSQAMSYSPSHTHKQLDMPRPCIEEQPSWIEDLLNEPESPNRSIKGHQSSESDPFSFLDANAELDEELCLQNISRPTWNLQMSEDQVLSNRKHRSTHEQQHNSWISSSTCPQLPNGLASLKEEAEFMALGLCCSPPESEMTTFGRSELHNPGDAASRISENSLWGSDYSQSQTNPVFSTPLSKSEIKRRQHNARRSRIRKLQYIAELEQSVQALQVDGVEASAQIEFLDQQNLLLAMENRALKQRLDTLSQELFIKSLEQEILDRELGRLQRLYQIQNINHQQQQQQQQHKQIFSIDRRGRSCDFDSQFSRLSLNPPEAIAAPACNGLKDFPYR